jgi:hypothetical protein
MNYVTHDLELAVIIHALKMWRHYLVGKKFELRIDNCGLKHLFGQPTLNVRKTRWLEFMSEYDFKRERKIKWQMHSVGEIMKCILHPLACTGYI